MIKPLYVQNIYILMVLNTKSIHDITYFIYKLFIHISINSKTKLFLYLKFKNDSKISSTYYGNEKAFFINENHFSCFWHLNNLLAFKIYNIIIRKLNKIFV